MIGKYSDSISLSTQHLYTLCTIKHFKCLNLTHDRQEYHSFEIIVCNNFQEYLGGSGGLVGSRSGLIWFLVWHGSCSLQFLTFSFNPETVTDSGSLVLLNLKIQCGQS